MAPRTSTHEPRIVTLADSLKVMVRENREPLVPLRPERFRVQYLKQDMVPLLGTTMLARRGVADRLEFVQRNLDREGRYQLFIAYAYRAPEVQERYYENQLNYFRTHEPALAGVALEERAHRNVADPRVAGHPTGGAVDVSLWDLKEERMLDTGSGIAEFGDIAFTNYPNLTEAQRANRLLVQRCMVENGFAPFLAEWWHFSFGDREWTAFYRKPHAVYGVVPLRTAQDLVRQ